MNAPLPHNPLQQTLSLSAELAAHLGACADPQSTFSYVQRVADDEAQVYPQPAFDELNAWGLHRYYVPQSEGGRLTHFDTLAALIRVVAGRDLTVAISHAVSLLGSMTMWLAGSAEQKQVLAQRVLQGERVSLALTEKEHGGDLLSMEVAALADGEGYCLSGEKWLVNGLNRNPLITVLARTHPQGGPRGFSLFLVDKTRLGEHEYTPLPKIATLGVRGADISGLRFNDVALNKEDRIGNSGAGFEIVLKGLQLSRTMCGTLSLGAADTGMAITLDFMLQRQLYGKTVADIPQSQRLVTEAWADILLADCLTQAALRSLHRAPEQASVHSAVVKYLVPTLVEGALQKLATVLGARYYLREEHAAGMFQKLLRDHLLIGLFDGSTMVNLFSLSFQLRALQARGRELDEAGWQDLLQHADWQSELPAFDWSGLNLAASGHDQILHALPRACAAAMDQDGEWAAVQNPLLQHIAAAQKTLAAEVHALPATAWQHGEPVLFEHARCYTVLAAASAALITRQANGALLDDSLADPAVWTLVLQRVVHALGGHAPVLAASVYQQAFAILRQRHQQGLGCGLIHSQTMNTTQGHHHGTRDPGTGSTDYRRGDTRLAEPAHRHPAGHPA